MPHRTKSRNRTTAGVDQSDSIFSGSGNVFADLQLPDPDLALAKAELEQRIRDLLAERNLTSVNAGELIGLDTLKMSELMKGRTERDTFDRLFRILNALGQQVEINVRPAADRRAPGTGPSIVILN